MIEFTPFPKIARLSREVIVTEKIDGTNAQILITEDGQIFAGSRTRWIKPSDDNYGFAKWVEEHKQELLRLGVGRHFGEWWGNGIQRGYGLPNGEKRFSLFNVNRWSFCDSLPSCVSLVPLLYRGLFDTQKIDECLLNLAKYGSLAAPGFMKPEGVVVFHIAANIGFKKTIEKDEEPKSKNKL